MSIPVFIRESDGTAWEERVIYNWPYVRESNLRVNLGENSASSIEAAYALYGVCSALHISQTQSSNFGKLDPVYEFLYGHTLKKLMEAQEEKIYRMYEKYLYEPQEWTTPMVSSMDWDLFCLAYYTFLCSKNDFKTKVWEVLKFILITLKSSPDILASLLSKAGRPSDTTACSEFWETVWDGLQTKTLDHLHENTCYIAFHTMTMTRPIFSKERYAALESECFELFDKIARTRIDKACRKTYTVNELLDFNIEFLFFYEDYFAQVSASKETKYYVMNAAFTMLHTKGDKVAVGESALRADAVYEAALKFAQSDEDRNLILNKRNKISSSVIAEKRKREKKEKEENIKEKSSDIFVKTMAGLFIASVVCAVLFCLLALFGVSFNKVALGVSLCVLVPVLIIFAICKSQGRRNKRW